MSKNFMNPTKIITGPKTRWSYANVWDAKSINGGTPKFSVSLIIPKSDTATVNKIKAAIQAAYTEGESKLKGNGKSVPALSVLKNPLRDGDLERPDDAAYADSYFINANSATAPGIVDADRQPILDRSEVYSGVYGRASRNGYYSRFYIAATKHIRIGKETLGVHLSYLYNRRIEYHLNGIAAGITYNPSFHPQLRLIAEYDSKDFALGATYLLFNHLHAQIEVLRMNYVTGGLPFPFGLK